MPLVDVGSVDEFAEGGIRVVKANGREVGVVRWGGEFFALRNVCPHQGAPVCAGTVHAGLEATSRLGDLVVRPSAPVLACAWHGWEFDLRAGRSITNPAYSVRTYDVKVDRGRVLVRMGGGR
jgi:nitrite reductase (NADH) small subunit